MRRLGTISAAALLTAALVIPIEPATAATQELHVAPAGSGTDCTRANPCALDTAQSKIRAATPTMTGDLVVNLASGTYRRTQPWTLSSTAGDGGTNGHRVIYRAADYGTPQQATPTISGGRAITGWTLHDSATNVWRAPSGDLATRQLYVNGRRATRAGQNTGLPGTITELVTTNPDGSKTWLGYRTTSTAMRSWRNPDGIELVYNGGGKNGNFQWAEPRCQVKSIEADGGNTKLLMKQPCFQLTAELRGPDGIHFPSSVENAFELLDSPGEWYLDRTEHQLYYKPREGEDLATASVVAPVIQDLVKGEGTATKPLRDVVFQGLTFADAGYLAPDGDEGFAEDSLNLVYAKLAPGEPHKFQWSVGIKNVQMPANVTMTYAHGLRFEGNTFTRLGAAGLTLDNGSQRNAVVGNVFTDISGQGVQVGNVDVVASTGPQVAIDNRLEQNYLTNVAAEYHGGYAIWIAAAGRTVVKHNVMNDLPRGGVASNHAYSYGDQPNFGHTITNNVITNWGKLIQDGGGFDSNGPQYGPDGRQPGTLLAENVFAHGVRGFGQIYLDWWSQGFTVENNVMYDNSYRSTMARIAAAGAPCCNFVRHNYGDKAMAWGHNDAALDNPVLPVNAMPASILANAGPRGPYFDTLRRAARTTPLSQLTLPAFPSTGTIAAPTGLTAGASQPGPELPLSWQPAAGATGYEVNCSGAGQPKVSSVTTGTSTRLLGLKPGDQVTCSVRARNATGALSAASNVAKVNVPGPTGLVGKWTFDGTSAAATDASGAKNAAKLWRVVGHYEAEDGVEAGTCSGPIGGEYYEAHTGDGATSCFGGGSSQTLTVTAPAAGTYTFDLRYSASREGAWSLDGSRTISLYVNGAKVRQLRFPWTGSWGSLSNLSASDVPLNAGTNTVALQVDPGDIGWISWDSLNVLTPFADRAAGQLPLDSTTGWVGAQQVLDLADGSFTLAARVQSTSTSKQRLLSKGFHRDNAAGYALLLDDGKLRLGIGSNWRNDAADDYGPRGTFEKEIDVSTTETFADGSWHHVAAVYDARARIVRLFVDGKARTLTVAAGKCGTARGSVLDIANCPRAKAWSYDPFVIGSYNASLQYGVGAIDDVEVHSRALSPSRVRQLAQRG